MSQDEGRMRVFENEGPRVMEEEWMRGAVRKRLGDDRS
jgi:hypothetical protein